MDPFKENLIVSEREWRLYLIEKIDRIEERLAHQMAWSLAFRIIGSSLFAMMLVWMEYKLTNR